MFKLQALFSILCLVLVLSAGGQTISGYVTDDQKQPLAFSSILIKGTGKGTSANAQGFFSIKAGPGSHILVCQRVGYQSVEKSITITNADLKIDFQLRLQQYDLKEITVRSGGPDPAYEIIKQAIKKRPVYEKEIKELQCDVYIKGLLRLRDYPKKILGQKVGFDDGDTSKKRILFLSETMARYSVQEPDKTKVEVLSTRVSGNSDGFGLSFPQMISFYHNNIKIGDNLNPRGFVSPIADNALKYYDYKLAGSFFENGKLINRIAVLPKQKYEPLFSGYINIMEDEWRVYSVQLTLLKEQQMQVLDTLKLEQTYVQIAGTWVLKQQVMYPAANLFGFDAYGSFVQVFSDYNLQPDFPKGYFGNTLLTIADSTNKKPKAFWDTIRPIPLLPDEQTDYQKKDSLEQVRKDPRYIDSVDRKRNQLTPGGILITGQRFHWTKKKLTYDFQPVYDVLSYNTVEGATIDFSPFIEKRLNGRQRFYLRPTLRYGFNNHHFNADLSLKYDFGSKYLNTLSLAGGKRVFQFNNVGTISAITNSINSLYYGENYLKLYEAAFASARFTKEMGDGFELSVFTAFQNRFPLENTTDYKWRDVKDKAFTPNYPIELTDNNIPRHQALSAGFNMVWRPGSKYIQLPDRRINIGSKYPTLSLTIEHGLHNVLASDVDYTKWMMSIYDEVDMKLAGKLRYRANWGGFLNSNKVFIPDYQHFNNSRDLAASEFLNNFQMMRTYFFSTTEKFYTNGHLEYHLNGLLTNKIPYFRKLNWFLIVGGNALYTVDNKQYYEYFVSLENILKVIRVDFVRTYEPYGTNQTGVRLSFLGLLFTNK